MVDLGFAALLGLMNILGGIVCFISAITQIINGVRSSTSSVNTILNILERTFYSSVLILSGVILLFNGWRLDPILLFQQVLLEIIVMVYVLQQTPPKHNRHTITTVLSKLSDLKVEQGQKINVGDIISDPTAERTKLQAKKQELSASLSRAILSLNELKPVPIPKFQTELQFKQTQIISLQTQLDKVDEELKQLTSVYSPYRGKVRSVKIVRQQESSIIAEVTLGI
jgi:hypothetical protein